MSDEHEDRPSPDSTAQTPVDTSRRRFLGGAAVLGVGATLSACGNPNQAPGKPAARSLTPQELDKALHDQVKTVVVIYAENRSFNNLFADFPGVEKPLSALNPTGTILTRDELAGLSSAIKARNGHLVVDEIYHGLTYGADAEIGRASCRERV